MANENSLLIVSMLADVQLSQLPGLATDPNLGTVRALFEKRSRHQHCLVHDWYPFLLFLSL